MPTARSARIGVEQDVSCHGVNEHLTRCGRIDVIIDEDVHFPGKERLRGDPATE